MKTDKIDKIAKNISGPFLLSLFDIRNRKVLTILVPFQGNGPAQRRKILNNTFTFNYCYSNDAVPVPYQMIEK